MDVGTNRDAVKAALRDWLAGRNPGKGAPADDADFYVLGLIDSFGLVEMIGVVEERFAMRFCDDDFRDPAFRTVGGLAGIIIRRRVQDS